MSLEKLDWMQARVSYLTYKQTCLSQTVRETALQLENDMGVLCFLIVETYFMHWAHRIEDTDALDVVGYY